jgi:hypothetical protein
MTGRMSMNKLTIVAVVACCTTPQVASPNMSSAQAPSRANQHILHMADALSDGIVKQFANKFA